MTRLPSIGGSDVWGASLNAAVLQLANQADYPPASANAKDDEFDGTSSVTWTSTPTAPTTWDINSTRPDHAYVEANGTGGAYVGKHQPVPGAYPYTIVTKLSGSSGRANYHRLGGIILAPAAPTGASSSMYFGASFDNTLSGRAGRRLTGTLGGTFSSASANSWTVGLSYYVKVTVNAANSVSSWISQDGYAWMPIESAVNPGFTPGVMGLACNEDTGSGGVKAFFDFFRVT